MGTRLESARLLLAAPPYAGRGRSAVRGRKLKLTDVRTLAPPSAEERVELPDQRRVVVSRWDEVRMRQWPEQPLVLYRVIEYRADGTRRFQRPLWLIYVDPVQGADRYRRMGAVQLFCGLLVATGLPFTHGSARRRFADFKAFLGALFAAALCPGLTVLPLILDKGPTPAPKQLATGIASWELAFAVRLYWLPTYASWLEQGEIIFSKVQRDVLTPTDFSSTAALECTLEAYFAELNTHPKPIKWSLNRRCHKSPQAYVSWIPRLQPVPFHTINRPNRHCCGSSGWISPPRSLMIAFLLTNGASQLIS